MFALIALFLMGAPCDGVCGVQAQVIGAAPVYQQVVQQQVFAAPVMTYAVQAAPVIVQQQAVYAAPQLVVRQAAPVVVKQRQFFAGRQGGIARQAIGGGGSININAARGARVRVK
jgi:hypothetical protein